MALARIQDLVRRNAHLVKPETRTAFELADADLYINDGKNVCKYYSDYAPYMARALDIMTSRAYIEFICIGSSRSAKTKTVLEAFLNWQIRCSAGDVFIYCSTQTKANEFGSKDIERCVRNTKALDELAIYSRDRWKIAEKSFKNGMTIKLGSPTETTTSASGYKTIICTDYDRSGDDVGQEGDKFELMAGRTTSLGSAAMAAAESSPGRQLKRMPKGMGRHFHPVPDTAQGIGGLYNQGTMERFYWQCTSCDGFFIPTFELIHWDEKETPALSAETAHMVCPCCNEAVYHNSDKAQMNRNALKHGLKGYWQEHQINDDGTYNGKPYIHRNRGSIWFDGCLIAARTWSRLVERYLMAMEQYDKFGDESKLKAFNNTYLGRNYIMQASDDDEVELSWLLQRAKNQYEQYPYRQGVIPKECTYLIMTVDIQNGRNARFVCQATAFTPDGMRAYIIDRFMIIQDENGDRVNPAREVDSWKLLIKQVMCKTYPIEGSTETMRPVKTVADMGGTIDKGKTSNVATSTTEIAYQFVKYLETEKQKVLFELSKGAARHTMKGFYNYSENDRSVHKDACPYLEMNGNMLSNTIRNAITRKGNNGFLIVLPHWMVNTPKQEWFDEILAEEQDSSGIWSCPKSVRNEAVDLTKMALSCSLWLNDSDDTSHQNELHDNPYVMPDNEHIFGLAPKSTTVTISDAALSAFAWMNNDE